MIKYFTTYVDHGGTNWRVNISNEDYTGDPIELRCGEQPVMISWDTDSADDPHSAYIRTSASLSLIFQDNIDIDELKKAGDQDFMVEVIRGIDTYWIGYIIPDGIQKPLKAAPYPFTIEATDGLGLLEKMEYTHNNLTGGRIPLNFIRQILFAPQNLGLPLPIEWACDLECTAFPGQDVFAGSVIWSARGEGFYSYQFPNGEVKPCGYILEGILKSFQCRLFQSGGQWKIRRIPDYVTGSFTYKRIGATLDGLEVTSATLNVNKIIGADYTFIREDAITTNKKAIKSCRVTYTANVRENIVPNGNQDIQILSILPLYWGITDDGDIESVNGIDGRGGYATQVSNPANSGTPNADAIFTTLSYSGSLDDENGLPIDAYTLVKRVRFGFIFSPVNGFPFNSETGIIDYSGNPFNIQIIFNTPSQQYWLDEFGIWRTAVTTIPIRASGTKIGDVIQIDFNNNNAIILPKPAAPLQAGDICDIKVYFRVRDGQRYILDYIYMNIDNNNDIYESTNPNSQYGDVDERSIDISSAFGGYMLSNYMSSWDRSDEECFFKDGAYYTGTLTGMTANAIMRWLYKPSEIFDGSINTRGKYWDFDQIYTIDGLGDGKFMPTRARYDTRSAEVSISCIECRNDSVYLTEKHYGSNDEILSN